MNEPRLHGSIFFLLKKFIIDTYSVDMWTKLNDDAHTSGDYMITNNYPAAEMNALISAASIATGMNVNDFKEKFGEYLVPDLFVMYKNYVDPSWKTFEIIQNTEEIMHGAVRKLNSTANPPVLNVMKISDNLLIIDYYSRRRMASLAVGMIRGIAKYYNEAADFRITPTTDPDAERVQIRLERC